MQKIQLRQPEGFWWVIIAAVLWGTIGIATQTIYNVDKTTSLFINLARLMIATPLLMAGCWHVMGWQMFQIRQRDFLLMMFSGTLLAISHGSYFAAIRQIGVTIPTLLTICIAPIVVTALSVMLRFERLTSRIVLALVGALVGSMLLVGFQSANGSGNELIIGAGLSLIAAITYASVIVCGRFLASDYHALQVTAFTFAASTLVLLPINLLSGVVAVSTTQGWLLILYLGLVPTALAYWLFQVGLRTVSATTASIVSMLDPLVAAVLAWILFGETLPTTGVLGAILLLLSIVMLTTGKRT